MEVLEHKRIWRKRAGAGNEGSMVITIQILIHSVHDGAGAEELRQLVILVLPYIERNCIIITNNVHI